MSRLPLLPLLLIAPLSNAASTSAPAAPGTVTLPSASVPAASAASPPAAASAPAPVPSISVPIDPAQLQWPDTPTGRLMREGVRLHDAGDFKGALKKYRKALELEPGNKSIHYEIANSLYQSGERDEAADVLRRALAGPGPNHPELYVLLGTYHDEKGDADSAIKVYREGLAEWPDYFNLHFNLGVTFNALRKMPEARAEYQRSVRANPTHASSHLRLGLAYASTGYPVPAIMALGRFLMLEPYGERAQVAIQVLGELLKAGVEEDSAHPDSPRVVTFTDMPDEEGPQEKIYTTLRILSARLHNLGGKGKYPLPLYLGMLLQTLGDDRVYPGPQRGFALNYYLPYYREMNHREDGFIYGRFCFVTRLGTDLKGVSGADRDKIEKFRAFTESFPWNAQAPIQEPSAATPAPPASAASAPAPAGK